MTATIYNYYFNTNTKEYQGKSPANTGSNPRKGATRTAPPAYQEGVTIPKWNGTAWEVVADNRGTVYNCEGIKEQLTSVGDLPSGWSKEPPPPTLEKIQGIKLAEANTAYLTKCEELIEVLPEVFVPPDNLTISELMELKAFGVTGTSYEIPINYKDFITLTYEEVTTALQTLGAIAWGFKIELHKLEGTIRDTTTKEELEAIEIVI